MTDATYEADGAMPVGTERSAPKFGPVAKLAAACLALGAVAAAVAIAPSLARSFGPTVNAPARAAIQSLEPFVTPDALAGPVGADSKHVLRTLLVKAGLRPTFDVHDLSWDQARKVNALLPAEGPAPDDVAKPFILSTDTKEGRQALHCLTQAAYFEAGANGPVAEAGVVQVVLNRVHHPHFPKSVCGVVYQGSARKTGCQFSFTCDGALNRGLDAAAWNRARKVAVKALDGYVFKPVGASTYYHADYVFPYWAPTLVKMATVGPHIFYAMAGAEGRAAYLTGRYAGGELKLSKAVLGAADTPPRKRDAVKETEATLKLASVGKVERIPTTRGERVHMQMAGLAAMAKAEPASDTKLNVAQTTQALQPAKAAEPAPIVQAAAKAPPPVAGPIVTASEGAGA